jgi:hypothetical protein
MFITVDGFNRTGIPNAMWELVEPHARIDSAKGVALLAVVILVLSNVASNVPTGNAFVCAFSTVANFLYVPSVLLRFFCLYVPLVLLQMSHLSISCHQTVHKNNKILHMVLMS